MKLNSLNSEYLRELEGFYGAVDTLQQGLIHLTKSSGAADLQFDFGQYLEQMKDLGHRLERVFALVNEKSLRIVCQNMNDVGAELQDIIESKCGNSASERRANRAGTPVRRGPRMEM